MLKTREICVGEEMQPPMCEMVEALSSSRDETFGNAGEMRNLAEALDRRRAYRILKEGLDDDAPLSIDDIPEKYRPYLRPQAPDIDLIRAEMANLVGIQPVKQYFEALVSRLTLDALRRERNPQLAANPPLQHLIFTGCPGTGKTTVARLLGRMYHALGLLRRGHCVEVSRAELVAGYVGQTALKTREKIMQALDGVLFIDEAYALERGSGLDFGREAIDTLVKLMEDFSGRLVVVAAGYPADMERFFQANPGLRSRFGAVLPFPNFQPEELSAIFFHQAARDGFTLAGGVEAAVQAAMRREIQAAPLDFGNARAALRLLEETKTRMAQRTLAHSPAGLEEPDVSTILEEDIAHPL
jgi:SpoVK/Ycf46/Vps4 family AAA+-type ATPase